MHLAGLHIYPLKSARGLSPPRAALDPLGLTHDRRFMVVDDHGRFLTQREAPRLALLQSAITGDVLQLDAPPAPPLRVLLSPTDGEPRLVRVWGEPVTALALPEPASSWLTAHLGRAASLVFLPDGAGRQVDARYAQPGERTAFADAFPLLLVSTASLEDLNRRLADHAAPVAMARFRPNLVVDGSAPFAEDGWSRLRIGSLTLRAVKPCERCVVTTIDPATGVAGREPLATLATYRRRDGKVDFGQYLVHEQTGTLALGDPVSVLA